MTHVTTVIPAGRYILLPHPGIAQLYALGTVPFLMGWHI